MGLLDDPAMNFGIGLMAAGGPSRMPVSLGQGIAQGFQQAQQAEEMQRRKAMEEMRLKMFEQQMMQQKAAQEAEMKKQMAMQAYMQNVPEHLRPLAGAFPEEVGRYMLGNAFAKPQGPIKLGAEETLIDPQTYQPLATGKGKEASLPWYVRKGPNGEMMIDPAYADFEKTKASFGRPPSMPMAPVAYVDPATGQTIWGTITDARGKPAANYNPALQGQLAGAKEAAKTEAEERTKAKLDAPRVIDNATVALKYSEELLKHPGFGQAVGKSSMLGIQKIPGTDGRDFMNRLDQLKGGAFLEAFNTLKGGGQITEVEGKKATDAIARMDNATSESEFRAAVRDYQDVIRKGMNRAKMKANPIAPVSPVAPQQGGVKFLGFE